MIVKVNWSSGKDSTCAVLHHLKANNKVKAVCYIPMFNDKIPLILKDHYDFIMYAKERLETMGAEVFIVHGSSYIDYVKHVALRGKNKGKIFGFPYISCGQCGFKRDSKLKALNKLDIGFFDYEDIGIAFDEWNRKGQLSESRRSILNAHGITEAEARKQCENVGLLSPIYNKSSRDGCVLCPNAKDHEIAQWLKDYPDAEPILKELQLYVLKNRPDRDPPRRGYKWFIDMEELHDT